MSLTPGYGETPVTDEAEALLPQAREFLGEPITKADVYDLEQAVQEVVVEELVTAVLQGTLSIEDLLGDSFVRDLHRQLYGDIWTWAGVYRKREPNIGIAPELIAVDLHGSLENIRYRWQHTDDWTARELGIAAHAESVRIHPFTDGNGRVTRLLADLVFLAAQDAGPALRYVWDLDKRQYIALLREYDQHRDPQPLAALIEVRALDE
ncbi:MAG: Fic family protein [Pseudonocardia sp.]|nr:Fic family protein [Pseudonocardia sp.]